MTTGTTRITTSKPSARKPTGRPRPKPKPKEETRVLYVQKNGSNGKKTWFRLTIPATARVTFGPLIPGQMQDTFRGQGGGGGLYLRVYRTKDHQLAVIPGVYQFRDSSVLWEVPTSDGFEVTNEQHLLGSMMEEELKS